MLDGGVTDELQDGGLPTTPGAVDADGHRVELRCLDRGEHGGHHRVEAEEVDLRWVVVPENSVGHGQLLLRAVR